MTVKRSNKIKTMLNGIKKYIYKRMMYQFDETKGDFVINPSTGQKVRTGLPSDYCKSVANNRYDEINTAIDNLTHEANPDHTFKTPKGNIVYYTIPRYTGRARIYYSIITRGHEIYLKVLAVTLPGMPIERVLSTFESNFYGNRICNQITT